MLIFPIVNLADMGVMNCLNQRQRGLCSPSALVQFKTDVNVTYTETTDETSG